jgi:hypothetical protein
LGFFLFEVLLKLPFWGVAIFYLAFIVVFFRFRLWRDLL